MLIYKITVKQMKVCNGQHIEKEMTADVVTNTISNPVVTNGGLPVVDAFMSL